MTELHPLKLESGKWSHALSPPGMSHAWTPQHQVLYLDAISTMYVSCKNMKIDNENLNNNYSGSHVGERYVSIKYLGPNFSCPFDIHHEAHNIPVIIGDVCSSHPRWSKIIHPISFIRLPWQYPPSMVLFDMPSSKRLRGALDATTAAHPFIP